MSGEEQDRSKTRILLEEKCGFSFKEEDLSPDLRKEIGLLSNRLKEIDQLNFDLDRLKRASDERALASFFSFFIGICFLFFGLYQMLFLGWLSLVSSQFSSFIYTNLIELIVGGFFLFWDISFIFLINLE